MATQILENLPDPVLLRACRKLADHWSLDPKVMVNLVGKPIQRDRALALLRIFEAVGDLHQAEEDARAWIREPIHAPGFGSRTPLDVMLTGLEGIIMVRDYLNNILNAWS